MPAADRRGGARIPPGSPARARGPARPPAVPLPIVDALPAAPEAESRYKTHRRLDRAARLFGEPGLHRLMAARVAIFGMGGVGTFAAESLARSGVGRLALVDFDEVCVTNSNRQLHALRGNIGKLKAEVMAERLRLVSPTATVDAVPKFYNAETSEELLAGELDFVVDAIDNLTAKAHLLATCKARGIPVVSSMGAAGKLDPTRIRTGDLSDTEVCPLARDVRTLLRKNHGLTVTKGEPTGLSAVWSTEPTRAPEPVSYDEGQGFVCVCPNKDNGLYSCDRRTRIDGSASFVTGAFGLAAASVVVRQLIA